MTTVDEIKIAEAWIEHLRRSDESKNVTSAPTSAFDTLYDLVHSEPEKAWHIIEIMWRLDSSDEMLANIAAGPVEDILASHGAEFIERIEMIAALEPTFKKMLGAVWGENRISPNIWKRLKAVAGPAF